MSSVIASGATFVVRHVLSVFLTAQQPDAAPTSDSFEHGDRGQGR
jgi:hypothetical protein